MARTFAEMQELHAAGGQAPAARKRTFAEMQASKNEAPGAIETFARQATDAFGFGDEVLAISEALGVDPKEVASIAASGPPGALATLGKLAVTMGKRVYDRGVGGAVDETVERYRTAQAENEQRRTAGAAAHPVASGAGVVANIAASLPLPGGVAAKGAGLASRVGRLAAVSGGYGAASGLGGSDADLTRGEFGEAAKDTAIGGAVGAVAAPLTMAAAAPIKLAGKGATALYRKVAGKSAPNIGKGAADIAGQVGERLDKPSAFEGETLREAAAGSGDVIEDFARTVGEKPQLRPSQIYGDPGLATIESIARSEPMTAPVAQAAKTRQTRLLERFTRAKIDTIARKPEVLERGEVVKRLTSDLDKIQRARVADRTNATRQYFYGARADKTMVDASGVVEQLKQDLNLFDDPAGVERVIKTVLKAQPKKGGQELPAQLSISNLQDLRVKMNRVLHEGEKLTQTGAKANERRIARNTIKAVDEALDRAGKDGSEGAKFIQKGNAEWARLSQPIDEMQSDMVQGILKLAKTDKIDNVAQAVAKMKPAQAAGLFRVLNKSAPETAQLVRAQMLEEVTTRAGMAPRVPRGTVDADTAAELARNTQEASKLSPVMAQKQIAKMMPTLQVAYAGDKEALRALADLTRALKRFSLGGGVEGSITSPAQGVVGIGQRALRAGATAAGAVGGSAVAGPIGASVGSQLGAAVEAMVRKDTSILRAVSDPAEMQKFADAVMMAADAKIGKKVDDRAARALTLWVTRMMTDRTQEDGRQ